MDLSEDIDFFEELRKDIEKLLKEIGTFNSVTANADRTVFEISLEEFMERTAYIEEDYNNEEG